MSEPKRATNQPPQEAPRPLPSGPCCDDMSKGCCTPGARMSFMKPGQESVEAFRARVRSGTHPLFKPSPDGTKSA